MKAKMSPLKNFGIDVNKSNFGEIAIYSLARAYALIEREISEYLRPFNLTPAKFNAMMVIKHQGKEKGLSQIAVGRQLIVTASNMTRLLDKLDKEGFIERLPQGADRRINLIRISKKGSKLLDQVWPGYSKKVNELAEILGANNTKKISRLLLSWCAKLESNSKNRKAYA